jgi:hypothetical protein
VEKPGEQQGLFTINIIGPSIGMAARLLILNFVSLN